MMTLDDVLTRWIPYRLEAVETLHMAWRWSYDWEEPKPLQVFVDGKLKLQGNTNAILNPMMEAGIVHARALLEFLGLCVVKGKLSHVRNRRPDDIAIEQFAASGKPLEMVSPQLAISTYQGPAADAERALVAVFDLANKGFAHLSTGLSADRYTSEDLDIACRGIPTLVNNNLYVKLGMEPPKPRSAIPADGR